MIWLYQDSQERNTWCPIVKKSPVRAIFDLAKIIRAFFYLARKIREIWSVEALESQIGKTRVKLILKSIHA